MGEIEIIFHLKENVPDNSDKENRTVMDKDEIHFLIKNGEIPSKYATKMTRGFG